ncbi:gliding motility lipoprotein GldB [Sinomicrobium soli]|uniref:gliding motility lipoprotein GldB n=1 Tax=Sinomicrobium sp. N-1-3-6 TaxID=2219864 RepID=UPI000DCB7FF3|nr:gliding motility lipoprotein GldB [Sinomicrobium sp. N-1-3-6]RAV30702.1 gliding motility lipoprotein GldB [Sinomicrobium sp. N-1-3-6]
MRKVVLFVVFVAFAASCKRNNALEEKISNIHVEVRLDRFDRDFSEAEPDDLPQLKTAYPFLFPEQYTDSVWIAKMNDTLQAGLSEEAGRIFPDLSAEREQLRGLFQHIKYYFPRFEPPRVVTLTSDVDYRNRVIWADSLLLVSLDCYLGPDHRFYRGIPVYLSKKFRKEHMVPEAAMSYARQQVPPERGRSFMEAMIYEGRLLYLCDLFLPEVPDAQKMGYTKEEMEWAKANEQEIWRYFVERDLLFSTDSRLRDRFIVPAPFSKFYLELDNESPGELGRFAGWQIVRAYMKNNNVSLQQMLKVPAEQLFRESRYKPGKK